MDILMGLTDGKFRRELDIFLSMKNPMDMQASISMHKTLISITNEYERYGSEQGEIHPICGISVGIDLRLFNPEDLDFGKSDAGACSIAYIKLDSV